MSSLKRPPKPTDYKHGDYHPPTGRIVNGYTYRNKWRLMLYKATNTFEMQIGIMYKGALQRARENNLPFDIDIPYLKSIAKQTCPIFGIQLNWGQNSNGRSKHNSASLDKIIPEWGYIKGNVAIISHIANTIKQNVTYDDLYKVADWLHDQEKETRKNVKPEQLTSLPKQSRRKIKNDTSHGAVHGTWPREDCDGAHHHSGQPQGKLFDSSPEESSGVGMGSGVPEVGTFGTSESSKDYGYAKEQTERIRKFVEHLCSQSRELGVAIRAEQEVRLPNNRRELEVQGPINEAIQSTEKTFKKLQEKVDPNWNSEPTGTARFVVTGRYTGFGTEAGDEPNKV
jgi:hypothetical protein